ALPPARPEPRSRRQRKSCARSDRSHQQMGRVAGEAVRISEINLPADAGRQWRQRRDHLFGELLNSAAASPECAADPLSGRGPRLAVSIPRSVRPARFSVFVRGASAMNTPVVLITGALTGIGRAAALAFAKSATVVVSGR